MENYNLTQEDLDFLIDLQHEMLTQDHVSQAAPRFWVVAGTQKVCVGREYAEGEQLIQDVDIVANDLAETVKYFQDMLADEADDYEEKGISIVIQKQEEFSFEAYKVSKIDTSVDTAAEDYNEQDEIIMEQEVIIGIDELLEALQDAGAIDEGDYDVGYYRNEHYRYPDTMFLTNRSCKQHIELNHYHYSEDAHSYAMTAWRSPEVSRLFEILDKIDWKGLKENAYGTGNTTAAEECSGSSKQS